MRRLAAEERPEICARLAPVAARVNAIQGIDIDRIDDSIKTVEERRKATKLKRALSFHPREFAHGDADGKVRTREEKARCGTVTSAGWSDAAYGDHTSDGRCRLGCVIGRASSTLRGPRRPPPMVAQVYQGAGKK